MLSPFRWVKSLRENPDAPTGANLEYEVIDEKPANTPPEDRSVPARILAWATSRKPSNGRIVTLSTEKDALRVVVFQGRKVVAWGSADPTYLPETIVDLPDGGPPEIEKATAQSPLQSVLTELGIGQGGRLWSLLDQIGIRRGRTVMDLSLYTTLTRQLRVPKVKGRYLEPVVLSEVLASLPFAREEVEIAWQVQQENAEDDSVFAVAMPKQRLEAQIMAAREAGLVPAAAYSKSAALASVSGVLNGIVIHLETSDAALVLIQDGYPKTVHEIEYGSEESSLETRADNLARAFGQVASYYQPADPQDQELPVILTGMTGETDRLSQLLRDKIHRRTLTIDPPLQYPQSFPVEEYAINLGLFLTDQPDGRPEIKGSSQSLALNLLPKHHLPNALPILQAAVFIILLLLAFHPINITARVDAKVLEKDAFSSEVSLLRGQQRRLNSVSSSFQETQAQLAAVSLQADGLDAQLDTLNQQLSTLMEQISSITRLASDQNITLTGVSPRGTDQFSLAGTAGSHTELLTYVQTLRDHPLFEDALVLNVGGIGGANPADDLVVTFSAQVTKAKLIAD
ncbi:MAG TPA: hypothetical protein VFR55_02060 [Dehalococcoidia bacterium]|nr:hypothetical protein [Dehalococcoidia bacterium]